MRRYPYIEVNSQIALFTADQCAIIDGHESRRIDQILMFQGFFGLSCDDLAMLVVNAIAAAIPSIPVTQAWA